MKNGEKCRKVGSGKEVPLSRITLVVKLAKKVRVQKEEDAVLSCDAAARGRMVFCLNLISGPNSITRCTLARSAASNSSPTLLLAKVRRRSSNGKGRSSYDVVPNYVMQTAILVHLFSILYTQSDQQSISGAVEYS